MIGNQYENYDFALHTDAYQINMAQVYFEQGDHEKKAVFEVYFRKLPFGNGYAVFAGLEKVIQYVEKFHFNDEDIQYLREQGYPEPFLLYLKDLKFTGQLYSMQEGEIVFPNEPLIIIEAPLIQCQLFETAILNIVNFQTLIATKASRIKNIIGNDVAMEFGTRRAQEMDAAIWGTRAAYIAGFDATSNVKAGKMFGIPISGTHAHAFVQAYRDEYIAFKKYAETHRDCVFLVDTYDTLKSGVPTAIRVAKELGDKINFRGIRLDSGDLAYLSKEARKMLDEAGFKEAKIYASNDLDEQTISSLKEQGAKIEVWGIGTKLITAYDQPALGGVYKLVQIEDENGNMVDTIKVSGNPEKITTPGFKQIYRVINKATNRAEGDYITLRHEIVNTTEPITLFHPVHVHMKKKLSDYELRPLHATIFNKGQLQYTTPSLQEIRNKRKVNLEMFWDEYRRKLNPPIFAVSLSKACYNNKQKLLEQVHSVD